MFQSHLGEFAALVTACCWTCGAMSFEAACKRAGSLAVNWIRLMLAFIFLCLFSLITRGLIFPLDANLHAWRWLTISGLIGFSFGDLMLFQAFVVIGSRIAMLIMALVPPLTALIGWMLMGELLSKLDILGMVLTISGIALVVLERESGQNRFKLSHPFVGLLLAFGGAVGQAVGLVFSKYGMRDYNAFAATQIRVLAGIIGFSILFIPLKVWPRVSAALKNRAALIPTTMGAFFGPFLGVSFSLLAVQNTKTGVASTIMAIVPVFIIPPAVILFKERVTLKEIFGAVIAVMGVGILFL